MAFDETPAYTGPVADLDEVSDNLLNAAFPNRVAFASLPTAGNAGVLAIASDGAAGGGGGEALYRDNGSTWDLLGVIHATEGADVHHAQSHSLGSHSTEAHSELTGVGASDHHSNANDHAQSHSLGSHSTEAHSELTGVNANDHHEPPTAVVASADEHRNATTTVTSHAELKFAVGANEDWAFEMTLFVQEDGDTNADMKVTVIGPSGATVSHGVIGMDVAEIAPNKVSEVQMEGNRTGPNTTPVGLGNGGSCTLLVRGSIRNGSTPGDCVLQFAQNTSVAHNSTIKAGSTLTAVEAT
jgi:hypothetical protein